MTSLHLLICEDALHVSASAAPASQNRYSCDYTALLQGGGVGGGGSASGGTGALKLRVLAARRKVADAEAAVRDARRLADGAAPASSDDATVSC